MTSPLLRCTTALATLALATACPSAPIGDDGGTSTGGGGQLAAGGGAASAGGGDAGGGGGTGTGGAGGGGDGGGGGVGGGSGGGGGDGAVAVNECAQPRAEWLFCEDFQSGSKAVWDDYDGNPDETNLITAEPGPSGATGNLVMRFRVPAGRDGADLVKMLPGNDDRVYARWYIKYEAGFDFTAANHGGGLHAGDRGLLGRSDNRPGGNDLFTAWVDYQPETPHIFYIYSYYRGMYQDCADPNGQCWGDHFPCVMDEGSTYCTRPQHRETVWPPSLVTDRWYCVEMMVDSGTPQSSASGANGIFDLWVDGQEIGPWSDLWLRTTASLKPNILWLNLFHHGEHSQAGIMYDNVVVSRAPIGCR